MSTQGAATVTYCSNPFYPTHGRRTVALHRRRRVRALAPKWPVPFIATLNGRPILRAEWRRKVGPGDTLTFIARPMGGGGGGGGKNPLGTLAQIALMVVAPHVGALAGPVGSFANLAARTAFSLVGSALINSALGGSPSPPTPQQATALAAPSPTYSLQAQGNVARLEQPIPSWYGYNQIFPDFGADPYVEYVGNEQYVYQLLVVGQGWYDIEAIRIEDTSVTSFEDITTEIVDPGGSVTLFPTAVSTSGEVAGAELVTSTTLGPFVANDSGTQANAIGIDLICSRGLYYANSSGGLDAKSVTVLIEAREIDDAGDPVGSFVTLGTETITGATTTPQRRSYRYAVTAGRYEVRATRTDTKDTADRAGHDVLWGGLRAYLPGTQEYGDITLIAMRLKASNQLSAQSTRRINVLATRMLPIWDAGTGWSAVTATRSIAWAAADICRAAYSAALPDAAIALTELAALDAIWTSRVDEFNGGFDQRVTFWEALTKTCRAGRAIPYVQGNIVRFVRDQAVTLPVAMFSPFNTVSSSWRTEYLLPSDDRADDITATYWQEDTWKPVPVSCVLPDSASEKPGKVKLFGVTNHDQAWREGIYEAACNKYRPTQHSFEAEMEGFILSPLDLIALNRDRPNWGQFGEIVGYTGLGIGDIIALSEPVTFTEGNHYLAANERDSSMAGPWRVTVGADAYHVVLAEAMTGFTPDIGDDASGTRERTRFAFGPGTAYVKLARVLPDGIRILDQHHVEITCFSEDDRVHTADEATVPAAGTALALASVPTAPVVTGLNLVVTGVDTSPVWIPTWNPAPGADKYIVEYSQDGTAWDHVGDTASTSLPFSPAWPSGTVRVAAIGKARGAWISKSTPDRARVLALSDIVNPDGTNAVASVPTANIVDGAVTNFDSVTVTTTTNVYATSYIDLASLTMDVLTRGGSYSEPFELSFAVDLIRNYAAIDYGRQVRFRILADATVVYEEGGYSDWLPYAYSGGPTTIWKWNKTLAYPVPFALGTSVVFKLQVKCYNYPGDAVTLCQRTYTHITAREARK